MMIALHYLYKAEIFTDGNEQSWKIMKIMKTAKKQIR